MLLPAVPRALPRWLKEKYHTIDALNHAWWTSFWSHHYDSFDEVEPPFDNGEQSLNGLSWIGGALPPGT